MSDRFHTNPKCLLTELDDGTGVVLHLDTKLYYTLNETGVFVWKELEAAPQPAEALAAALLENFEVEPDRATLDLALVLETLVSEGLVHPGS
jgi:hypothetical protein